MTKARRVGSVEEERVRYAVITYLRYPLQSRNVLNLLKLVVAAIEEASQK